MTDPSVLYGLRPRTPRLELRLGTREELLALGRLAKQGIHQPVSFHTRGIGTGIWTAVLELVFRGLGALRAESGWHEGNEASRRVSRKLGYLESGTDGRAPRGQAVPYHLVALERAAWRPPAPEIVGLGPCLVLFGLSGASAARR